MNVSIFCLAAGLPGWVAAEGGFLALAEELSKQPWEEAASISDQGWNYDAYRKIRFRRSEALWLKESDRFRVEFFHLGYLFRHPVLFEETVGTTTQALAYSPGSFSFNGIEPPRAGEINGYAGFRILHPLNRPNVWDELGVFQGASYFRFLGKNHSYGLSARGLAIDSAEAGVKEEFPRFSRFRLERPRDEAETLVMHALLESESVTGSYRFDVRPGETTRVEVDATLFFRASPRSSLGIAPLTSMYWYGENTSVRDDDFRPEVHDSDGLLLKMSSDRWLWRPLVSQENVTVTRFPIEQLHGFGLLQRDRNSTHYQDYANPYQRTPSLFVEPIGNWGPGEVRLSELPTHRETDDNIVAFWCPERLPKAGEKRRYRYRLHWTHETDEPLSRETVVATRSGWDPFRPDLRLITIDFDGPELAARSPSQPPQVRFESMPPLTAEHVGIVPSPHDDSWRVTLKVPLNIHSPPETQLRITLTDEPGNPISETWQYPLKKPKN